MKKQSGILLRRLSVLCVPVLLLCLAWHMGLRVNLTGSLPCLLYRIVPLGSNESPKRGDNVVIDVGKTGNPLFEQAVREGYIRPGLPMLKTIGAVPGDTVTLGNGFFITDSLPAPLPMRVASQDGEGRALKAFPTPVTLASGDYWLISDPNRGFDSRYFGPIRRRAITHRACPVF